MKDNNLNEQYYHEEAWGIANTGPDTSMNTAADSAAMKAKKESMEPVKLGRWVRMVQFFSPNRDAAMLEKVRFTIDKAEKAKAKLAAIATPKVENIVDTRPVNKLGIGKGIKQFFSDIINSFKNTLGITTELTELNPAQLIAVVTDADPKKTNNTPSQPDRTSLLNAIRARIPQNDELTPVGTIKNNDENRPASPRLDLLNAIRAGGTQLKPGDPTLSDNPVSIKSIPKDDTYAADAILKRRKAMEVDDDEPDESDDEFGAAEAPVIKKVEKPQKLVGNTSPAEKPMAPIKAQSAAPFVTTQTEENPAPNRALMLAAIKSGEGIANLRKTGVITNLSSSDTVSSPIPTSADAPIKAQSAAPFVTTQTEENPAPNRALMLAAIKSGEGIANLRKTGVITNLSSSDTVSSPIPTSADATPNAVATTSKGNSLTPH